MMELTNEIVSENGTGQETFEIDKLPFNKWFLMSSPVPVSIIVVTYLMFVIKIGPQLMKNRKPFKLRSVLLVYNIIQVAISYGLGHMCVKMIAKHGLVPQTCVMDTDANRYMLTSATYYYFLAKLTELLDTVFFVLRKKDNQVTFLHVYHHALMVFVSWSTLKYEPNYVPVFLGTVNSFIHVLMYTYYGLSAFPSLSKYLWWKKYITSLQLIQFVSILIHFSIVYTTSECTPSYIMTSTVIANIILFIYMFGKFYINNYIKNDKAKVRKAGSKANLNGSMGQETEYASKNGNSKEASKKIGQTTFINGNRVANRKINSIGNR